MKQVYLTEVAETSKELVDYSKKNIKEKLDELEKLTNNFVWEGPVKESYIRVYKKKIKELNKLNDNMCKIAEFLLTVKEGYSGANEQINNAYEELMQELRIKGHVEDEDGVS